MRTLRFVPLLAVVLFGTGCGVGDIFGPPTAEVSVEVSRFDAPGDVWTPYINGVQYQPPLTDMVSVYWYRADIQVRRRSGYRLYDYGDVYVQVWSANLGCLSRTKRKTGYTDRLIAFEFRETDFDRKCK